MTSSCKPTKKGTARQSLLIQLTVSFTSTKPSGVPLTLLKINNETEIAVVEMGASHPGDIKELVNIALPNFGLITNVGKAHLLGFGSFEGVMKTKGELYDYLRRTADKVFLNADNPYLCRMAAERELHNDSERPDQSLVIPYGLEFSKAKVLTSTPEEPFLRIGLPDNVTIRTNLIGSYNADNVMAALAVGEYFGISSEDGIKAIEAYVPSNKRSQMTRTERNTLIIDAYNANPTSMEAALKNFSAIEAQHKIAMLGDMLELGDDSLTEHIRIAGMALDLNADKVCFVGKEFEAALENIGGHEKAECFPTSTDLAQWLDSQSISNTVILIKGSRGTRMENVIETL